MTLAVFQEKGQILTKYLYSDTSREKKRKNFKIQKGQSEFVIGIRTDITKGKYKKDKQWSLLHYIEH